MRNVFILNMNPTSLRNFRQRKQPFAIDQTRSMIDTRVRGKTVSCQYPLATQFEPTLELVLRSYVRLMELEKKFLMSSISFHPLTFAERVLKSQIEYSITSCQPME